MNQSSRAIIQSELDAALAALSAGNQDAAANAADFLRAHGATLRATLSAPASIEFAGEVVQVDDYSILIQGSVQELRPARQALQGGLMRFAARRWSA